MPKCMVRDLNLLNRTLFVKLPFLGLVNLLSLTLWTGLWGIPHLDKYPVQKWFCQQIPSKSTGSTTCKKTKVQLVFLSAIFSPSGACRAKRFYLPTSKSKQSWDPSSLEPMVALQAKASVQDDSGELQQVQP